MQMAVKARCKIITLAEDIVFGLTFLTFLLLAGGICLRQWHGVLLPRTSE